MIKIFIRMDSRTGYIEAEVETFRETKEEVLVIDQIKTICSTSLEKFQTKIKEEGK